MAETILMWSYLVTLSHIDDAGSLFNLNFMPRLLCTERHLLTGRHPRHQRIGGAGGVMLLTTLWRQHGRNRTWRLHSGTGSGACTKHTHGRFHNAVSGHVFCSRSRQVDAVVTQWHPETAVFSEGDLGVSVGKEKINAICSHICIWIPYRLHYAKLWIAIILISCYDINYQHDRFYWWAMACELGRFVPVTQLRSATL